jgi:hypothetical protein
MTRKDGKWRAADSLGYAEHAGAVAAITAQHLEEGLTPGSAWPSCAPNLPVKWPTVGSVKQGPV